MRPMMTPSFYSLASLVLVWLLASCASQPAKPPAQAAGLPDTKLLKFTTAAAAKRQGKEAAAIDERTEFTSRDPQVVALAKFRNLVGDHRLHWEWIAPDGRRYHRSSPFAVQMAPGYYRPKVTVWQALPIRDEDTARQTGDWTVRLFMDGRLESERHFGLTRLVSVDDPIRIQARSDPNKWGLVIGIENYANLPKVENAAADARAMRRYLRNVVGVPDEQLIVLRDGQATRAQLRGYLRERLPNRLSAQDTLYVFFAGHGVPDLSAEGVDKPAFLMPYDGDQAAIRSTGYRVTNFYADIEQLPVAHAYVFADACFTGATRSGELIDPDMRPALLKTKKPRVALDKTLVLSAADMQQVARSHPDAAYGLFTHYLLLGLRGEADENRDDQVTVHELHDYVRRQVEEIAREIFNAEQTPVLYPRTGQPDQVINTL